MSAGFIYVVEVGPHTVKIGRSSYRYSRLTEHAPTSSELLAYVSPRFAGYRGAETEILRRLASVNTPTVGLETFFLDFAVAVAVARAVVQECISTTRAAA